MVVNVLVELSNKNIDKTFDYLVPKELEDKIGIGKRVTVPFQHLTLEGFILDTKSNYIAVSKEYGEYHNIHIFLVYSNNHNKTSPQK